MRWNIASRQFSMNILTVLLLFSTSSNQIIIAEDQTSVISLPEGTAGIGFDDLRYSSTLNKVLVPSGRTGILNLVDPETHAVTSIAGFSAQEKYGGGHGEGITSVAEGHGLLFVTDRSSGKLNVVDVGSKKIVSSATLASSPDYVRFLSTLNELWVTEPDSDRIEIFSLPERADVPPLHSGFVEVKGGPESLLIDETRVRAYTHLWEGKTVSIDLKSRKIVSTWANDCHGSRGIAMDKVGGFLFVGCSEGKAVSMDITHDGKILSTVSSGSGVDIIDYNLRRKHLYLPGGKSATMAIIEVSAKGFLTLLRTVPTVEGAHCVTTDQTNAFVCDPNQGKLLVISDGN